MATTWQNIQTQSTQYLQDFLLNILSAGPIPRHVAFVLDGNRRYARKNHQPVAAGHHEGFHALRRILEVCLKLKVRCVSAYVFSIENFKRSEEEVNTLMKLAEEKLLELCQHGDLLDKYGVRLNVVGNVKLLPETVQAVVRRAEEMTRHNDQAIFNVCMSYTARDEITTAVETTVQNALETERTEPISEKDIEANLMTTLGGSPPLDILVRTSGVKRLSDFLLWQCSEDTQLHFSNVYWPEFGLFDFIPVILNYQRKMLST